MVPMTEPVAALVPPDAQATVGVEYRIELNEDAQVVVAMVTLVAVPPHPLVVYRVASALQVAVSQVHCELEQPRVSLTPV